MRTNPNLILVVCLASACCAVVAGDLPPTGSGYEISWSSVDAGTAELDNDGWRLSATVGQPEVSISAMQGGNYQLRNGYWLTPATLTDVIFADGFE